MILLLLLLWLLLAFVLTIIVVTLAVVVAVIDWFSIGIHHFHHRHNRGMNGDMRPSCTGCFTLTDTQKNDIVLLLEFMGDTTAWHSKAN